MSNRVCIAVNHSTDGKLTTKVYRDREWNEYRVRLYDNTAQGPRLNAPADHHTDCRTDALRTARVMVGLDPEMAIVGLPSKTNGLPGAE